jgi:hypothetical protein
MSSFPQHLFRRHATRGSRETNTDTNADSNNNNESSTSESPSNPEADTETSNNHQTAASIPQDENVLIVPIPSNHNITHHLPQSSITFLPTHSRTITTQQRRAAILAEVERVQRANFIHFALLCLVPTSLLLIVIAAIFSQDGECNGIEGVMVCERESRSFVNAFTTRCVCDAVMSVRDESSVGDENGSGLF